MKNKKERKLTPAKVLAIYLIAFSLVSFHELSRVTAWLEGVCLKSEAAPETLAYCNALRGFVRTLGLDGLVAAEDRVAALARKLPEIGSSGLEQAQPEVVAPTVPQEEQKVVQSAGDEQPLPEPPKTRTPQTSEPETDNLPPKPAEPRPIPEKAEEQNPALTPPQASLAPAVAAPSVIKPRRVLIAGDSTILEGFGVALQRELKKHDGISVFREGTYSSGLSRPDYFDWQPYLAGLVKKHRPDLLVISLGANDPQDILDEKRKRHHAMSEGWNAIYADRTRALLAIPGALGIPTIWVGLPVMEKEGYGRKIANINKVVADVCGSLPLCRFVDTWEVLADEAGAYRTYQEDAEGRPVRIRAKDGIHLTEAGGRALTQYFLGAVQPYLQWPWERPETGPDGAGKDSAETGPASISPSVAKMTFFSRARNKATGYFAYLPKAMEKGEVFPVLYLLHGAWDGYTAWQEHADAELRTLAARHRIIIVTPDGDEFGWYVDSPVKKGNEIETFFMKELIPHVEANFPTAPDRRGVAGLSMGGHGAMVLAMRNPGVFLSASSMSGILDITKHPEQWHIKDVLGPYEGENRRVWAEHSAFGLASAYPGRLNAISLLASVSLGDQWALPDNRAFHSLLKELGAKHEYHEEEGGHDWAFWTSELPRHVVFHAEVLNRPRN